MGNLEFEGNCERGKFREKVNKKEGKEKKTNFKSGAKLNKEPKDKA